MNRTRLICIVFLFACAAPVLLAQSSQDRYPDSSRGRPGVGVASVNIAAGDVSVLRGDSGDRLAAFGGAPLLPRDTVNTGRASRAEVQLGPGNFVRLGEETEMRVLDLGNRYYRLVVLRGVVSYSSLRGEDADISIEALQSTVRPLKDGVYRVAVRDAGQADVIVRKGEAEVSSGNRVDRIKKGQRLTVRGEQQVAEVRIERADREDSFDDWNERRDKLLARYEPGYRAWGWPGYYYDPWFAHFGFGYGYGFYGWPGFFSPRTYVAVRVPVARVGGGGHRGRR